jgi:hypothetical protein
MAIMADSGYDMVCKAIASERSFIIGRSQSRVNEGIEKE